MLLTNHNFPDNSQNHYHSSFSILLFPLVFVLSISLLKFASGQSLGIYLPQHHLTHSPTAKTINQFAHYIN